MTYIPIASLVVLAGLVGGREGWLVGCVVLLLRIMSKLKGFILGWYWLEMLMGRGYNESFIER